MKPGRAPNYRLTEAHEVRMGQDYVTLPQGAWVRPVEACYLPKHITESDDFRWFNPEMKVYCYTRFGFHPIPRDKVETA
jgi:hypothetical protein